MQPLGVSRSAMVAQATRDLRPKLGNPPSDNTAADLAVFGLPRTTMREGTETSFPKVD